MRNNDIAIEEGSICVVQDVVQNSEPMRSVNTTTHYEASAKSLATTRCYPMLPGGYPTG